jgi:hypothetical protein
MGALILLPARKIMICSLLLCQQIFSSLPALVPSKEWHRQWHYDTSVLMPQFLLKYVHLFNLPLSLASNLHETARCICNLCAMHCSKFNRSLDFWISVVLAFSIYLKLSSQLHTRKCRKCNTPRTHCVGEAYA